MSFLETPRFPGCPRFGFTSTPQYSVTITQTASGRERRNRNWARALNVYSVQIGPKMEDEIQEILEFWHAMGGPECGFRLKDWSDYRSCRVSQTVSSIDQVLVLTPGSPGGYQLTKTYQFGTRQQVRNILKPVQGTVKLADAGVLKTENVHYLVDYTSGIITTFFSPVGQITAGYEFDVPVRFDSEFPLELSNHQVEQVSFQLREIRDPTIEE